MTFANFPLLETLNMPEKSDNGIKQVMRQFQFAAEEDSVQYNGALQIYGLTKRGQKPAIGSAAFENRLNTPGIGQNIDLAPEIVALQVALTIGHELSHVCQFNDFRFLDLKGREDELDEFSPVTRSKIENARLQQHNLLEALGYQSEIYNLNEYKNHYETEDGSSSIPPAKLEQINALQTVAIERRDYFFDQLPEEIKNQFLNGAIEQALNTIHSGIPESFIELPLEEPEPPRDLTTM